MNWYITQELAKERRNELLAAGGWWAPRAGRHRVQLLRSVLSRLGRLSMLGRLGRLSGLRRRRANPGSIRRRRDAAQVPVGVAGVHSRR